MMKADFLLCLIALLPSALYSQDLRQTAAAKAACGPFDAKFEKGDGLEKKPAFSPAPPGKALVYVIEANSVQNATCIGRCGAETMIGLDGAWVGATAGNSFVSAAVDPGDHHLCAHWISHTKAFSHIVALQGFKAEAGNKYYFGVRVSTDLNVGGASDMSFEPLNEDEAKMLLEVYPLSKAKPSQ